jgi:alpha-D-ribose 1-methylphosphonate 5-triphosphate synthase subunit PhnH
MMETRMLDGGFANPPHDAAHGFRAALQAMARPGRIEEVAGAAAPAPCSIAASVLLLTLCDKTTGIYLAPSHDTAAVRDWITFHVGAPFVGPEAAVFALGTWDALMPVSRFPVGTSDYPDRGTTLIVEMSALSSAGATLKGPGIKTTAQLSLPEIAAFQTNRAQFPLGLDFYLTCGSQLAGLPRSTRVMEG